MLDASTYREDQRLFGHLGHDIVPATERLAVPISAAAVESFIEFCLGRHDDPDYPGGWSCFCKPDEIGWDLNRLGLLGDEGQLLFKIIVDAIDPDMVMPDDEFFALMHAKIDSFKRDRLPTDRLLIDQFFDAETQGWQPPPEISAAFDRLIDIADKKRAEIRAAREAAFQAMLDKTESSTTMTDTKPAANGVDFDDFVSCPPLRGYVFKPTCGVWTARDIDTRLPPVVVPMREKPMAPSVWLNQNQSCECVTWAPGLSAVIKDKVTKDGGWQNKPGCSTFNTYSPSTIKPRAGDVSPWLDLVRFVYPDEADHIIAWCAHRVQRPHDKINHALVIGGVPGIGKDSIFEPLKAAVGAHNFKEISPHAVLGNFNGFLKAVVLRISEARDLGEVDRFDFYERMKTNLASPPDMLRVNEKFVGEYYVANVVGVIITTNYRTDGIYLAPNDRRHFVAWSPRAQADQKPEYWPAFYKWLASGGNEAVAYYLAHFDLSGFDAKAPPLKTPAFHDIVDAGRSPQDAELADILDKLRRPDAVTLEMVKGHTDMLSDFRAWLSTPKNRRAISHRFDDCDYIAVRNPDANDGLWRIAGKRQAVYARKELSARDQIGAAQKLSQPSV